MLKRCSRCQGTRKIRGMGYIEKKCPACDGLGVKDIKVETKAKDKIEQEKKETKKKTQQRTKKTAESD